MPLKMLSIKIQTLFCHRHAVGQLLHLIYIKCFKLNMVNRFNVPMLRDVSVTHA